MPRDALIAMRTTMERGPDFCPSNLFAGDARRVLLGLKAHANTIAHARHVALEETFPRTRSLMGAEVFHDVANDHLADSDTLARRFARIGEGFDARLDGTARNLARIEWAWLDAHGAPDAKAFDLEAIADRDPNAIATAIVLPHPAARLVAVDAAIDFDGEKVESFALVVRPHAQVCVHALDAQAAELFAAVTFPTPLAELLETDADAAIRLVTVGALTEEYPR